MRSNHRTAPLCVAALLALTISSAAFAAASSLDGVRKANAKYHSVTKAKKDGFGLLKDAKGIACIDQSGTGGMGLHYVNGDLVGDGKVKSTTPEALVYERKANGKLRLVAAEYVVFQEAWDANHEDPPSLFNHEFELIPAGNRYGLPAFYELHAWAWKHNELGTFANWNPDVSC
jgi:hypothetical protein